LNLIINAPFQLSTKLVKFHQRDSLFLGEVMLWLDDRGRGIGNERCSSWLLREILQESFSLIHFPKKQHLHGHHITVEDEETLLASHLTLLSQLVAML
jgi:hypothetical protein